MILLLFTLIYLVLKAVKAITIFLMLHFQNVHKKYLRFFINRLLKPFRQNSIRYNRVLFVIGNVSLK